MRNVLVVTILSCVGVFTACQHQSKAPSESETEAAFNDGNIEKKVKVPACNQLAGCQTSQVPTHIGCAVMVIENKGAVSYEGGNNCLDLFRVRDVICKQFHLESANYVATCYEKGSGSTDSGNRAKLGEACGGAGGKACVSDLVCRNEANDSFYPGICQAK